MRADVQTGGRGRLGRAWVSPAGNLYASRLVRLRKGDPPPATLALVTAVALDAAVSRLVAPGRLLLKWPNDVLLDGAKLSGILLEAAGDALVIGVGVNLAHAPEGLGRATASLDAAIAPAPFLTMLEDELGGWIARWRDEGLAPVRQRWLERAHPPGTPLEVRDGDETIRGRFAGLASDGALQLLRDYGSLLVLHAGDVALASG